MGATGQLIEQLTAGTSQGDDGVHSAIGLHLLWIGRLLDKVLHQSALVAGFSGRGDYEVLAFVSRRSQLTTSPIDVARALHLSTAGVTGRIDRLEADGLLVRIPDKLDRRALILKATPQGEARVADAMQSASEVYHGLFEGLTIEPIEVSLAIILQRLEA